MLDVVLGQPGCGPADAAEVEAAVLLAGACDRRRAVPFGQHHERTARLLELVHVGVHPTRGRGSERTRCIAVGGLRRPGVVDTMVAQVLRHLLAPVQQVPDPRVGDIAGHHHGPRQAHPCCHRQFGQLFPDLRHRLMQVDPHHVLGECLVRHLGKELRRIGLQPFQEDALAGDLGLGLPVGRTRHRHRHRQ